MDVSKQVGDIHNSRCDIVGDSLDRDADRLTLLNGDSDRVPALKVGYSSYLRCVK